MDRLEQAIRASLEKKFKDRSLQRGPHCIVEEVLSLYLENRLSQVERQRVEKHLADCPFCLDLIVVAKKALDSEKRGINIKIFLSKQKWLILALVSLLFSFILPRYFLQFLVITLIFGIKWAVGSEGAKNLVMIFRSMHKEDISKKSNQDFTIPH